MPTLRRILKYTPATVLGLLLVAWVVSPFVGLAVGRNGSNGFVVEASEGNLWIYPRCAHHVIDVRGNAWPDPPPRTYFGRLQSPTWEIIGCPIPFMLAILLPLAIGPFLSFRFRLWHYLAYTALLALELAYYLRWQE